MYELTIENKLELLSADAVAIRVLTTDVSEGLKENSDDYFKLHAVYTITEKMEMVIDEIIERLTEAKAEEKAE